MKKIFSKNIVLNYFVATTTLLASVGVSAAMEFGGDFRYRHQSTKEDVLQGAEKKELDRTRQRLRLRLKGKAKINDKLKVIARITTGDAKATSTNQTVGDGGQNFSSEIDMAYFKWAASESVNVMGGKTANPYVRAGKSDLIFDGDYTPEGLSVGYNHELGSTTVFVNVASHWLEERQSTYVTDKYVDGTDSFMHGAQLGAKIKAGSAKIMIGAGKYHVNSIYGESAIGDGLKKNSEVTSGSGTYGTGFDLTNAFVEVSADVGLPVKVYFDYVVNGDAKKDDTGMLFGFDLGKAKKKGSYSLGYSYRKIERDAILGALTDGDFNDGGGNAKGHRVKLAYATGDSSQLKVTYHMTERNISDTDAAASKNLDYNRLQLDFAIKF